MCADCVDTNVDLIDRVTTLCLGFLSLESELSFDEVCIAASNRFLGGGLCFRQIIGIVCPKVKCLETLLT